jgi:hypothetical protein
MPPAVELARDLDVELRAHLRVARIDVERRAGLRIDQPHETDVRERALARVLDRHRDDVVPLREQLERPLDVRAEEVGDEKDDRLVREHLVEILRRAADVRAWRSGLEGEDVADQAQRMPPALSRRHHVLDRVGEHHTADAIVVPNRRHREHRGKLGRHLALEATARAESLRPRHVDGEHHRELALLDVPLHVGALHARRHVPIDAPHFVARLILAYLGELHSLPFEHRTVFAGEERVHEAARAQLEQPDLSQYLGRHCLHGVREPRDGIDVARCIERHRARLRSTAKQLPGHGLSDPATRDPKRHQGDSIFARTL